MLKVRAERRPINDPILGIKYSLKRESKSSGGKRPRKSTKKRRRRKKLLCRYLNSFSIWRPRAHSIAYFHCYSRPIMTFLNDLRFHFPRRIKTRRSKNIVRLSRTPIFSLEILNIVLVSGSVVRIYFSSTISYLMPTSRLLNE